MHFKTIILAAAIAAPSAAFATQNTPASDFAGNYSLEAAEAAINVHVGLAAVGPDGQPQTWAGQVGFALDVDGIDEDEAADIHAELFDACTDAGLPAGACSNAAEVIAEAVVDLNQAALDLLPESLRLAVGSWGWVSNWFGLYPAYGKHTGPENSFVLTYLLNNNDGAAHGDLLSGALSVNGFASNASTWACVDVSAGVIAGNIDQHGGFALEADFLVDRELACVANLGGGYGIAGTIGIAYGGVLTGSK